MRHSILLSSVLLISAGFFQLALSSSPNAPTGVLPARWHDAGFADGDDNYNAVTAASDGKIYYVLCAHKIDVGAQMFSYDPKTGKVTRLADLTEVSGEKGSKAIPQGKSHVPFFEHKGKLYFATHLGYYEHVGGKELVGVPPKGYKPYPGGHFLSYDLASGKTEKLADAPPGEGIITMAMDQGREEIYALTWPSGLFLRYDLKSGKLKNYGFTAGKGERGTGKEFRVICRAIAVDQRQGFVSFTTSAGDVMRYTPRTDKLEKLEALTLRRDTLGNWDPDKPGHMGYNWRQMVYYPPEQAFYGVHGNTGFLLRFDSWGQQVDVLDRIASAKSRASGSYDKFSYGYLGLTLGPDGQTLYFLTGTPDDEEVRFVTYHIPTGRYTDHGAIAFEDGRRPTWAQAIAVGPDKRIYTVSKMQDHGKTKVDLLSFADPLQTPPAAGRKYEKVYSWLNPQGGPNPLKESHGLCVDKDGNVLVVDSVDSRVQRFTPDGKWLGEIGLGPGSGPGQFQGPRDARTLPATGEIFVSDANNYRVEVFSHEGKYLRAFGTKGSGPGQFLRAHGLAFSPDYKRLYLADVDNNRVSVFEPSGKLLFEFGKKGIKTGEFREAHGIGVAGNGDVIVTGYFGPTQRFDRDGKFLYEFAPSYLAARDPQRKNALVIYDNRGGFVTELRPFTGDGEKELKTAYVDSKGLVYIAVESKGLHGVQVFRVIP
ncbi:MAG: 6-bladed beta-propeller [Acidobacteria bacterium]|nr:6-bladed beta-propeller [Acidobacteriota bacterium]